MQRHVRYGKERSQDDIQNQSLDVDESPFSEYTVVAKREGDETTV